jgi:hypothetical protein
MKTCSRCKESKALTEYYKDKLKKDGREYHCKLCKKKRPPKASYQKAYHEANKEKIAVKQKAYYQANKEKIAVKEKAYREANKEKRKATCKAWAKANPEKLKATKKAWCEVNRELDKAQKKAWRQANSAKCNAYGAKYRAAKLQRTPAWLTPEDHEKIADFYLMAEYMEIATGTPHEVDHIIPLQGENVSGLHVPTNLQVLTESENRSKSNRFNIG